LGYHKINWSNSLRHFASRQIIRDPLFTRIALADDLPKDNRRRGDLATIVGYYAGSPGQEPGYELETFNAVGDTCAVVTLRESQIESLRNDELLSVRPKNKPSPELGFKRSRPPRQLMRGLHAGKMAVV
jgi:hypothetical protein